MATRSRRVGSALGADRVATDGGSHELVSGGRALLTSLIAAGVDTAFCVPGESFLGVLEAMHTEPRMRVISSRHEEGAAFMAVGYSRVTGRPSVCLGTRMVGAANLMIGLHTAQQDAVPVIAVIGQTPTKWRYRRSFQEVELAQVFSPIVKWAVEVPSAARLSEVATAAARIAMSGRPGPVAIIVREDILTEAVEADEASPLRPARPGPDPAAVAEALRLLRAAARPFAIVGEDVTASSATDACVAFAEAEEIPFATAWRRPDAFPNDHRLYLGWSGLRSPTLARERTRDADVLLVVGTQLTEFTTAKFAVPSPGTTLIHVDVEPETLGGHRTAHLPIVSDSGLFMDALLAAARTEEPDAAQLRTRASRNRRDRAEWEAQTTPTRGRARSGYADQQAIAGHLRNLLPSDSITVTDGGNFAGWPARYLRWNASGSFLGPISGAMGYGVPAAIGAKLARPDAHVVVFSGDGGFLMTGVEFETAVRERLPIVSLVYDNSQYGTIRMHQEHEHPGRRLGTDLGAVDFAALARSLGARGYTVSDDRQFPDAFRDALAAEEPAVIHLLVDPEQLFVGDDGGAT